MNSALALVIAKFLIHSWRDIEFNYDQLTPAEKSHGSKSDFERLVVFNWDHIRHYEPKWFKEHNFTDNHDAVVARFKS